MEKFYPEDLDSQTIQYFIKHSIYDETLREKIAKKSSELNLEDISIPSFDANIISTITKMTKPKKVVEIGSFLGYSAITIAKNMPDDGRIYTIEKDGRIAQIAIDIIREEGVSSRITLVNEDALEYLPKLSKFAPFDMCFIDADEENYPFYFKWSIKNIKSGGVLVAHNVFLKGKLFYEGDDRQQNRKSRGMREFLYNFFTDEKISSRCIIPTYHGIAVGVVE